MPARVHFRAHGRRKVDLGATIRDRKGDVPQAVRIRDLGLGGACVEVGEVAPPAAGGLELGAPLTIEVMAPTLWDPLILLAKVAWVRRGSPAKPTRAGIRFEHRDASALYALFQLLGSHNYDA